MKDQLEDFIKNNRSAFDIDEPSPMVWAGVERSFRRNKLKKIIRFSGIAASVLILISAGYFMGLRNGNGQINESLFANEVQYNDFQEAQNFYTKEIDNKMVEVKDLGVESDVQNDLTQLDEIYNDLKKEMLNAQYKDKELLINLMINNYRTKIEILERIIGKTKNSPQSKTQNNETISI